MNLLRLPVETETMPTLNDVYKLAESTDRRLDAMEDKLENIHAELRVAIRGLVESFGGRQGT